MEITEQTIERLAKLAKLKFDDQEKVAIKADLQKMLAFVSKVEEIDTTGLEPLVHVAEAVNVLRSDEPKVTITRAEALKNAPDTDGTYFKIPKVLSK